MHKLGLYIVIAWFGSICIPGIVHSEIMNYLAKLRPFASVQEEYTDNVDLSATNKQHDFITTVSAGIGFSPFSLLTNLRGLDLQPRPETSGFDLAYSLGLVFYARNEERNYLSHNGSLDAWYNPERGLTVRVRDSLIRSDEGREPAFFETGAPPNDFILGTQRERAIYFRNVFQPSIGYKFGKERSINFTYTNNVYKTESATGEDSQENYLSGTIDYWFTIRHGVLFEYVYQIGTFDNSPDFKGSRARMRYTYRHDPRLSLFADSSYYKRDLEDPGIDYQVQNPSIGFDYAFTPTLNGIAQIGYYWYKPKIGEGTSAPSINISLTHLTDKTSYSLFLFGGFQEDFFSSTNFGGAERYRTGFSASHRFSFQTTIGANASIERNFYLNSERTDWVWAIQANIGYQAFRWLAVNFGLSHQECDSNIQSGDYKENRATIKLSLLYQ